MKEMEAQLAKILATLPKSGDPAKDELMTQMVSTFFKRGWVECASSVAVAVSGVLS